MIDKEIYLTLRSFENKKVKIQYKSKFDTVDFVVGTVLWINEETMYITTNGLDSAIDIHLNDIIKIRCTEHTEDE